ncbi:hypothetical protein P154DRAFT_540210 [Amniculicola lignicola CBS 123094]|uniref:Uncharacterized protein n=1 Tax=Amniculicola lignicola CBS 123094 TaxID=1392246 RepID=A0A6A5VV50_9PLEO|nr:hypothetical protein P154DRAFT_540210 [Amniculicola lignicola CBS 123094]
MISTCLLSGNADMYGLGIRIGYYLQWFGLMFAAWLCPEEVQTLRLTHTFFVAATFLAVLTQVPKAGNLDVVEIYIILLFTFGSSLSLLPVLLWRIAVRCRARLDPSRFPKARPPGRIYNIVHTTLLASVLAFQLWFWISKVRDLERRPCRQYGFLFKQAFLDGQTMRIVNLVLCALLLALVVGFLLITLIPRYATKVLKVKDEDLSNINKRLIRAFHIYQTASRLFVAVTIITATELTIHWNNILGVNAINTAGQTIPLVLGIGAFLRVLYIGAKRTFPDDDGSSNFGVTSFHDIPGPGQGAPVDTRHIPWYQYADQPCPIARYSPDGGDAGTNARAYYAREHNVQTVYEAP